MARVAKCDVVGPVQRGLRASERGIDPWNSLDKESDPEVSSLSR